MMKKQTSQEKLDCDDDDDCPTLFDDDDPKNETSEGINWTEGYPVVVVVGGHQETLVVADC